MLRDLEWLRAHCYLRLDWLLWGPWYLRGHWLLGGQGQSDTAFSLNQSSSGPDAANDKIRDQQTLGSRYGNNLERVSACAG